MALALILQSFARALGQVGDKRFLRVLLIGVALTLALLVGAYAGLLWLVEVFIGPEAYLPVLGEVRWLNDLLSGASLLFMLVLSIFLMVPVASAITSMFLDDVAQAVEAKHYAQLPPAKPVSFADGLRDTINFLGVLIGANMLALVLYLFFAPFALLIFWALNGFLLGREYFTLAASRRLGRAEAQKLRSRNWGTIWLAGVLMAAPLSLPLVNLFVPILGAATFTHLFHGIVSRQGPSG
ncbi:EI24 domain-containing protein [Lentibacter sp. XHP0401]|jgi:CysZ protein|uniref:EI24 domain-containing protein n=1 Tax=Lentibacter sp. XHP0401 TaxID=2984334 RepID=UPI0021E93ED7|nr:EI24 domain-containing protein [Lentibacter sp. XHP0401]MCV2893552.1 EI24 domain-containing protein [Lentibacter sp. XHP0401]